LQGPRLGIFCPRRRFMDAKGWAPPA
jgi:hypothetical protein